MRITIPGNPIAWKRPAGARHRYDAQKAEKLFVRQIMKLGILACKEQMPVKRSDFSYIESLEVEYIFLLPIPRSLTVGQKNKKLWHLSPCDKRPDWDNLAKFYTDCGNGILWEDDMLIQKTTVTKRYSENPQTIIQVERKSRDFMTIDERNFFESFSPRMLNDFFKDISYMKDIYQEKKEIEEWERDDHLLLTLIPLIRDFSKKYFKQFKRMTIQEDGK